MRNATRNTIRLRIATALAASLLAIGAANAQAPGAKAGLLAACPDRNNCVNSDATDPRHAIAPFRLKVPPAEAWSDLKRVIEATPDTQNRAGDTRLPERGVHHRATALHRRRRVPACAPQQKEIAVRSASRFGYYDFGVNRERIEALRAKLREKGVVE